MIKLLQKYLGNDDNVEVLSKGFSFLVIRIVGTLFSFAFTLYMTNTFGKEVWGLFAITMTFFTLFSIIGTMGLDTNLVKFYSQDNNINDVGIYFRSILKVFTLSSILVGLLLVFGEFIVNDLLLEPKPELLFYFKWMLPSIPFWSVVLVSSGLMRSRKLNKSYAFYSMTGRFLILVLIVVFFSFNDLELILRAFLFSIIFLSIISIVHSIFILKKVALKTPINSWGFVKESIPMMLSSSILVLMSLMDTFIMGVYYDESEVGVYNVAVKITTLSVFSLQAINSILAPKIAKFYASGDREIYLNLVQFSTKINFFITLGIVALLVVFNAFLLDLFGDGFQSGFSILIILCIGQLINSLSGSVGVIMQMIGEQNQYQRFIVMALAINLVLTFILTPIYAGIGASVATVFSMIFWNIAGAIYLKKKKHIQTYFIPF